MRSNSPARTATSSRPGKFNRAVRNLRNSGLKLLATNLPPGLATPFAHAVELAREDGNLVATRQIQPRREVAAFADGDRVPGDVGERRQHHPIEYDDEQSQCRQRGDYQIRRRVTYRAQPAFRNLAGNIDVQRHQRVAVDIGELPRYFDCGIALDQYVGDARPIVRI